jgi:hypothetical protein
MFRLVQKLGGDARYRWGRGIETAGELSIEHKEPWLSIDPSLFWDLNNVAFSHLPRNTGTSRRRVERLKRRGRYGMVLRLQKVPKRR